MTLNLAAVYADGWDNAVVNPLTRTVAEARDAAGEPYTVLLLLDGRCHGVIDVSWRDGYCHVSRYDPAGRQISSHELRGTPDGDLFLFRARTWAGPPDVGVHEFPHVAARHETTYRLAGGRRDVNEPRGDRGSRTDTSSGDLPPRLPVPAFGGWRELLALAGDSQCEIVDADGHPLPVRTAAGPPWQPPRPLRPDNVEELFHTGTARPLADRRMRLSTHPAGTLRLSSGRVVAADPGWLQYDNEPFTVTVPPGTYPVTISLATFVDDPDHHRVAAARLEITDRPVVAWELAMRADQDPLDLGAGEYFGFGVDAGMACFADVEAYDQLPDLETELDGLVDSRYGVIGDGAVVAWHSGWGDGAYPTWIGRDPDGQVVCFVADMLLFGAPEVWVVSRPGWPVRVRAASLLAAAVLSIVVAAGALGWLAGWSTRRPCAQSVAEHRPGRGEAAAPTAAAATTPVRGLIAGRCQLANLLYGLRTSVGRSPRRRGG